MTCAKFVTPLYRPTVWVGPCGISESARLAHNLVRIGDLDARVPDVFGIDDHHGTVPALSHAAGVVNPDSALQAGARDEALESCMHAQTIPIHLGTPVLSGVGIFPEAKEGTETGTRRAGLLR
jgi:hypothetical protein